ncbi:Bud site selection protein, Revert to axial protein 1 [Coemansia javaensis]|uniref:Bud site selection protein, Revert to axial protein 1 n=1 Tax=Coemansia javaensis TaxID=2761396 RepID=A0A9W8H862_9FUNG|nr:Bud site selection protein, Revert to axial protein 1 [Coemansia javaensis]
MSDPKTEKHGGVGSEKAAGSDTTAIPAHAVSNATALLAGEQLRADGLDAKRRAAAEQALPQYLQPGPDPDPAPAPESGSHGRRVERRLTRRGRSPGGGGGGGGRRSPPAQDPALVVAASLLDPHPIIVPPPGSRLAFAGAAAPHMVHKFRALPSLEDTLLRRAKEPLCLYNYWQYLADVECGSEELEFWLSLADYEALFRRHAGADSPAVQSPQLGTQLRGARIESGALGIASTRADSGAVGSPHMALSQMQYDEPYDPEAHELDERLAGLSWQTAKAAPGTVCRAHRQCTLAHRPFTAAHASGRPTLDTPRQPAPARGLRGFFARMFSGEPGARHVPAGDHGAAQKEPLLPAAPDADADADAAAVAVPSEDDMRRAAERLYFHYFLPESPMPLRVSPWLRDEVAARIERDQRFDARVFSAAKRHAYEAMLHESHLRFLRERLFHNITRGTAAPRIVLGLALVFVALAFQLALIFLDVRPKGWRWLPMAGLWPGFVCVLAGLTRLDPFMVVCARYESTAWSFGRVRDRAVLKSHVKRAILQLIAATAVSAIISLVMFLVPGHRL